MCDCFDDSLFCIAVVYAGTLQLAFGVLFAGNRAAFFVVAYQLAFQFVVFVLRIGAQKAVVVKFFGRPVRNLTQQFRLRFVITTFCSEKNILRILPMD